MKRLQDVLQNVQDNYLYPFFWQHGEDLDVLKDYLDKMNEQGIYNACIESRPHPEFMEEGWWKTMDFLVEEAKKRGMHLWILDDARFPTGYANGKVPEHLKKKYLQYHRYDLVGTAPNMDLNVNTVVDGRTLMKDPRHQNDRIRKVLLAEKDPKNRTEIRWDTLQDVTDWLDEENKTIRLQLNKKHYALYVFYETMAGDEDGTKDYLDPMRPEAVDVLLNSVYEPHYERYKEHFGKTITAFFSDEPRFGNAKGPDHIIGKSNMPLPWNETVEAVLEETLEPADWIWLFEGKGSHANEIRHLYMDLVSRLYSEHFSKRIGRWCYAHGIQYVGHVIEDNNCHARLGYGPGHYFRAMEGEDVAGIDIIGGQVVPGMDYHHDAFSTGGSDGEFYHYGLCKLAQSAARLDPKKNGVVMCEAFGAYGWIEGLKMMKWITDLMIAGGVNCVVPHAFSPKAFPDFDCPPHFYAHGNNPLYPYFGKWSSYADRLCHLFSGGDLVCDVAVLYQAPGEWSGGSMYNQEIIKALQEHQIESSIVSEDHLMDSRISHQHLLISGKAFSALVIPQTSQLPEALLEKIVKIAKDIPVFFLEQRPCGPDGVRIDIRNHAVLTTLEELPDLLEPIAGRIVETIEEAFSLQAMRYKHDDGELVFLFNTDVLEPVDVQIQGTPGKMILLYDAMDNNLYQPELEDGIVHIHLEPYESLVLAELPDNSIAAAELKAQAKPIKNSWEVKIVKTFLPQLDHVRDYQGKEIPAEEISDWKQELDNFSGAMIWKNTVELSEDSLPDLLEIPETWETVHVTINNQDCGTKIAPPYAFDIKQAVKDGTNAVEIATINSLARAQRDPLSIYIPMEPLGIHGEILLKKVD